MTNWKAPTKVLLVFGTCLAVFLVLRLFVPVEYALLGLTTGRAVFRAG